MSDKRYDDMRAQLDGALRDLDAANSNMEKMERDLYLQLAAAKPVLSEKERADVEGYRKRVGCVWMLDIIDRAYPPPKAPPTDAELASSMECARAAGNWAEVSNAIQALRARGAR